MTSIVDNYNFTLEGVAMDQKCKEHPVDSEQTLKDFEMLRLSVEHLQEVKNKTKDVFLSEVQRNGLALQLMTPGSFMCSDLYDICLAAVEQNGLALEFVNPNLLIYRDLYDISLAAVNQNGLALKFVDLDSFTNRDFYDICLVAVKQDGHSLQFVDTTRKYLDDPQTYQIARLAVESKTSSVKYLKDFYRSSGVRCLSIVAVEIDPLIIQFIDPNHMTSQDYKEVCMAAINKDPECYQFVDQKVFYSTNFKESCLKKWKSMFNF